MGLLPTYIFIVLLKRLNNMYFKENIWYRSFFNKDKKNSIVKFIVINI